MIHLRLAGQDVNVLAGHADVNLVNLGIGLQLGGGNGIPNHAEPSGAGVFQSPSE